MFSRWGRFVYRRRRWVLLVALLVGLGMAAFAGRAAAELSAGGWLDPDSESQAVAERLADDFGAGKGTLVLLYLGQARRRGDLAGVPGGRREVRGRPRGLAAGRRHRGLCADGRRPVRQHERRLRLRRRAAQRLGRGVGRAPRRAGGRDRRAGRGDRAAPRRLRPADPRLRRAVREGPHPRRDHLAADRRDRADPGVRVADRGRAAAARRRARDPHHARRGLLRRPGDRALDLRPERLDDARASRSRSTTRCSWSAGSARSSARAGRSTRRSRSPSGRPARPSRSRASRSPSACRACWCSRPRRFARSASAARSPCSPRCSSP